MNSIAVGIVLDLMITGTVSIACFRVGNGIRRLMTRFGSGRSFKIALVIKPRVPSEPIIRSFKS